MNNCLAIIGGTFNPVHIGHLRLAIEISETLRMPVEIIPCFIPPHKKRNALLPFSLRQMLLETAIAGIPDLRVNDLEKRRSGPSYTWDTLAALGGVSLGMMR